MAVDITTISVEMDTSSLRAGQAQLERTAQAGVGLARSFVGVAAAFGVGLGVTELSRKLLDTERVTGSLIASLEVATGGTKNAESAFASLAALSSELPESLNDVTKAFTMMVNLGLDPSQAAIKSYSNTASAMNKSLLQMVEAVADATTGQYERLKEFGIKASTQGDKVAFTFRGTTTTVKNSTDEITKYLKGIGENEFAGMAEKKMATLDGAISNLGDSWDGLFRTINEGGLGQLMGDAVRTITSAISEATAVIKSGQLTGIIEAMGIKFAFVKDIFVGGFNAIADGAKKLYETWYALNNKFLHFFGYSTDKAVAFYVDAFKSMPENIKAFIQLVVVEIAVLVDKAKAYGETIAFYLNPKNLKNDVRAPDLEVQLKNINAARDDSIALILQERDATTTAAKEAMKAANERRVWHNWAAEKEKENIENLGKYKVEAEKVEGITKEQQKAISEAAKAEASRAKNIADLVVSMTRETDLMDEQSKEAQIRYDIEKNILEVKGGINGAEAQALINAAQLVDKKKEELKLAEELNEKIFKDVVAQTQPAIDAVGAFFDKAESDAKELSRAITDALMRGFESGKGFAQNMADVVKNTFKTMVLKPRIEAFTNKVADFAKKAVDALPPMVQTIAAVGSVIGGIWNNYMDKAFKEMTSEVRQSKQSTGTLLGNANAKSDSINHAIQSLGDNGKSLLDVNHGMYQALVDIRTGITGSAAGFAKTGLGNSAEFGIKTGEQGTALGKVLMGPTKVGNSIFGAVFGDTVSGFLNAITNKLASFISSKKTSIIDSGIQILGGTLADALASGTIGAMNYAEVQTTKKILGLAYSNKVNTKTSELDSLVKSQFAGVFEGAGNALKEAAKTFGATFDPAALMIDATKLSLKGLQGDALTKEIESFFSSTLDKWAVSLEGSLSQFQKVGEGAFETMMRLAQQTNIFASMAEKLNLNFHATGIAAVQVTQDMATLAGGFDQLAAGLDSYYQYFLSDAERTSSGLSAISSALKDVGLTMPSTREGFRAMVEGLDLSSAAQQKQFAALMNVSGAFAQLVPATERAKDAATELVDAYDKIAEQHKTLSDRLFDISATDAQKREALLNEALNAENRAIQQQIFAQEDLQKATESANRVIDERYSLEGELLQLQGNTAALRERELQAFDESNRALKRSIYALEDQKAAADLAAQAQEEARQAQEQALNDARQAQEQALNDARQAQEQALNDARQAADEQKKLAQGVYDSISGALKALMGESDAFNSMSKANAKMVLQGALVTAKAGGSLVGYAGLEDALSAVQKTNAAGFGSSFEFNRDLGQNIGLLSELEKYTRIDGSHANGLDSVPYDGYVAQLHKGERVQTAAESKNDGELVAEIRGLREEIRAGNLALVKTTGKATKIFESWDGNGTPAVRAS